MKPKTLELEIVVHVSTKKAPAMLKVLAFGLNLWAAFEKFRMRWLGKTPGEINVKIESNNKGETR